MDLLAQIIGVIGFIIGITGYFCERDRHMKIFLGVSISMISTSFFIMGAYTGAVLSGISAVRFFIAVNNKSKILTIPFMVFYIISGYFTYSEFIDIFPILASLFGTYALFNLKRIRLRVGIIFAAMLWLCYDFSIGSIGACMLDISTITANIIFIIKSNKKIKRVSRV